MRRNHCLLLVSYFVLIHAKVGHIEISNINFNPNFGGLKSNILY